MAGSAIPRNTIRTFALVCVAATSVFVIIMGVWVMMLLSDKSWCERALGTAKYVNGRPEVAISGCFSFMGRQLDGITWLGLIYAGVVALSLLVLMVVVVAGGRLSFKAGPSGAEGTIGSNTDTDALHDGDSVTLERGN